MANVIKTVLTYPLNGSTTDFHIPFEYLARKFVKVTLLGKDRKELALNTDYRFATRTTIATTKAWGSADGYTMIELRRYTSATERLVDFTDGSILRAYDLNVAQIQTMHVAEEARDLTADTIGVNNDGDLDARNRRIVNVADATDDRDAVPFGQLKTMNQNSWQARNEAQGFRNEAQNFRNQAETFKNNAAASASSSAQSASESAGSASAAKVSESNASNSKNAAAASQSAAATSERNAKTSETNAKSSETNAKTSESKAKESEELVIRHIESYGSLPIGSVIATPVNKAPAGFLRMDGSTFNEATYQALFLYLGTNKLPDWRGRYLKGALNDGEVGVLKGWGIPAHSGSTTAAGEHNHTGTTSSAGDHNHTGTTSSGGAHQHNLITGRNDTGSYHAQGGDRGHVGNGYTAKYNAGNSWISEAGAHTHTMTTNTTGNHTHTMTTNTVGHHQHTVNIPAQGTGVMDVDHVKVYWWIKAFGSTDEDQLADVTAALNDIHIAKNTAQDAANKVNGFDLRIIHLEEDSKYIWIEGKNNEKRWYSLGQFPIGQFHEGLTIIGNMQSGNNVQNGNASSQGISWMAKVWGSNGTPSNWVNTQVNCFGGPSNATQDSMPITGICCAYTTGDNVEVFIRPGVYGHNGMVRVFSTRGTIKAHIDTDAGKPKNPPSNAMGGAITHTAYTTAWNNTK